MSEYNWLALWITIAICLVPLLISLKKNNFNTGLSRNMDVAWTTVLTPGYKFIFVFIMVLGFIIRFYQFGSIPGGVNQDEAMGAVDALALAQHGTDRFGMWLPVHFTAWGFGQMSVLLSYISTPFIALFGLNIVTTRIAVLIVSMLALLVIYLLSRMQFGRGQALCILAFCALNPWQIMQSRWALDCNMLPHFMLFSVFFLVLGLTKNKRYIYLSMVFFGLTMYTYGIAWYSIPLFLGIAVIYALIKKMITIKETIFSALTYLFFAWPIFAVMIINLKKWPTINTPFFTIPFFPGSQRSGDLLFFSDNIWNQFKSNAKTVFNIAVLQKEDLPWNSIPDFGVLYRFSLPFLIVGLIACVFIIFSDSTNQVDIKKAKSPVVVLMLIWLLISVISGIIINSVNVNRINIIFYPLIFLAGMGIYFIITRFRLLLIPISIMYFIAFLSFGQVYFTDHSQVLASAFYDGFGQSMEYVKDMDYDRVYVTNHTMSENSWWVSEPLAMFYHQVDAEYFQGKADAVSKTGRKLLPYSERYRYSDILQLNVNPDESAVYVVHNSELYRFDTKEFDIKTYASYSAIVPKTN